MNADQPPLLRRSDCAHAIAYHPYVPPAQAFREAGEALAAGDEDTYGDGSALNAFERKIAALLGTEAAVFLPSGTMAQQIALRITADRTAIRTFAAHPTNHVVLHERDGFARLHDLHFVPVGSPFGLITLDEVKAVAEPVGTLLLELPQREIGGRLPSWEELLAIVDAARSRGWRLHLDGARLWECGPFYGRPYAEIAGLFDRVYVSFYKGIGALAGAMLAGRSDVIAEARVWQRRHGGNLITMAPFASSAERLFDARIERMADYAAAAVRVAAALARYPDVEVVPRSPQTNMLHVFVRADADALLARAQRVARDMSVWTIGRLGPTSIPGVHRWEISCGDATLALGEARLAAALDGLFTSE